MAEKGKAPIATTMRNPGTPLDNTSCYPEQGIRNQYYGPPKPSPLAPPAPGTGQPLNGGLIDKEYAKGGMKS